MDLMVIIAELKRQRDGLDQAIISLQQLAVGTPTKRRGRPPKWLAEAQAGHATTNAPVRKTKSARA